MARERFGQRKFVGEEWRDVVGWEGLYQVSSAGRVRRGGWMLKCSVTGWCVYPMVSLSRVGAKPTKVTVHSLVAAAFIGPRPPTLVTDHVNGIKTDNRASNLRYVTDAENLRYAREARAAQPRALPRRALRPAREVWAALRARATAARAAQDRNLDGSALESFPNRSREEGTEQKS